MHEIVEMYRNRGKVVVVVKDGDKYQEHRVPKRRLGIRRGDDTFGEAIWLEGGALLPMFDLISKEIVIETAAAEHALRILLAITAEQCGALNLKKMDGETYVLAAECLAEVREVAASWPIPVKTAGQNTAVANG